MTVRLTPLNGVEAAIRLRGVALNLQLEEIDRELDGVDFEIEQLCRPPHPPS